MTRPKKTLSFILVLLAGIGSYFAYDIISARNAARQEPPTPTPAVTYTAPTAPSTPNDTKPITVPTSLLLKVPWTPQAPTANWDELHNEACEEASALMVDAYFSGVETENLTPAYAEREIAKLTEWQKQNYGYYLSITPEETARMIRDVYKLKAEVIYSLTEAKLKETLAANKLIVLPLAGREIGNPNFRAPGPLYHMLVVTGYDEEGLITNEPGTRKGHHYRYSYDTLYNAIGLWSHATHDIDTNVKPVIIVSK